MSAQAQLCQWCGRSIEPDGHWTRRQGDGAGFVSICRVCSKSVAHGLRCVERIVTEVASPTVLRQGLIRDGWSPEDAARMTARPDYMRERFRADSRLAHLAEMMDRIDGESM